ncbi:hypothetical protein CMI42_05570 [Candidatus Pacearchaeota archaeon]|nr:hypothetical protein [Candidatus Pacearchaeota archaeon]|tara:strand:- start:892 stop:1152 length:261 start_codon:yes stop_codon:yes gene_type:complete
MDKTVSIRNDIGFTSKKRFLKKHANYKKSSLKINSHEIMQSWESNYMKKLASISCKNGGRVLEVGFGMGIAPTSFRNIENIKPFLK